MKKSILFFIIVLLSSAVSSQSWTSSNIISGTDDITIIHSDPTPESGTVVLGYYTGTLSTSSGINVSSNNGSRDYFVAKLSNNNDIEWIHSFGSSLLEYVLGGISVSEQDTIFVTGGFRGSLYYNDTDFITSTGAFDTFLAKMDPDGNVVWCKNIGEGLGATNQRPNSLKIDNSGNLLLSGFFTDSIFFNDTVRLGSDDGVDDYFYGKFEPINGDLLWVKQIKALNNTLSGRIFDIAITDTTYTFIGMYADSVAFDSQDTLVSANNSYDIHIIETDTTGDIKWIRSFGGDADEYMYTLVLDNLGDIYLAGYYDSPSLTIDSTETETTSVTGNNGDSDVLIAKYNASGTFQWIRTEGGISTDKLWSIDYYDDEVHVTGLFTDTIYWGGVELGTLGTGDQDMFYASMDIDGNFRNASSYSGRNSSTEEGRAIFNDAGRLSTVISSNSDLLVLGDSSYLNPGKTYIVAIGNIGCLPISFDNIEKNNVSACFGDETGSISIDVSGGFGPPYQYSIDNGSTYKTSTTFNNLPAGSYQTIVVDAENCAQTGPEVTISQPDELLITNIDSSDVLCNSGTTGSINVQASGGTGVLTYSVNNGITYPNQIGSEILVAAGTYNITVKDENNCVLAGPQIIIEEPMPISLSDTVITNINCFGTETGAISITPSGGTPALISEAYTFEWTDPANSTTQNISNLAAGEYSVTVTDSLGCNETFGPFTISVLNPIIDTSEVASVDASCFGANSGSASLSASGGASPYTFEWVGQSTDHTSSTANPIDLIADTYDLTITDANNCQRTFESAVTIDEPSNIEIIEAINDVLCNGGTSGSIINTSVQGGTQFTVGDPYIYSWTGPNDFTASTEDINNLDAGEYTLIITDSLSCEAVFGPFTVNEASEITATLDNQTDVICPGDSSGVAEITASGGTGILSFEWNAQNSSYRVTNESPADLIADSYDLTIKDEFNCEKTFTDFVTISEPEEITIDPAVTDVICAGASTGGFEITASNGTAPYQYSIDGGETYQENADFTDLPAGMYEITVMDGNGCMKVQNDIEISEPPAFGVDVNKTNVLCYGGDNGQFSLEGTGGTAPYEYSIDGGTTFNTTNTFYFLEPGTFNIQVKDANDCLLTGETVTIIEPDSFEVSDIVVTNLPCFEEGTGSLMIETEGGTEPHKYAINSGSFQTSSQFDNLSTGTYTIKVVDASGCMATAIDSVIQPDELVIDTVTTKEVLCYGGNNGELHISPSGGTTPYSYSIDSLTYYGDSSFLNLSADTLSVHVLDANNCYARKANIIIQQNEPLSISLLIAKSIFKDSPGRIEVTADGGAEPYVYTLMPGNIQQDNGIFTFQNASDAGDYIVQADDANNCGPVETENIEIKDSTFVSIEQSLFQEFNIYPNPTKGEVTIEFYSEKEEAKLEVISIDGKLLIERKVYSRNGEVQEKIDLSGLNEGIYYIRIDNVSMPTGILLE